MHLNLEKLAESQAPGQGEIAQVYLQFKDDEELQEMTNIEMVENLKRIYDIYVQQKMKKSDFFPCYHGHGNMKRS